MKPGRFSKTIKLKGDDMSNLAVRKSKIVLSDYNFRRDVEIRLLTAHLTTFEVTTLKEILDNSLKFPLSNLSSALDCEKAELVPVIEKFKSIKLLKLENEMVVVEKDMRKHFESHFLKFDEDFEPGVEFIQILLNKVPIQHLPQWYGLPRTTNHIFQTLVEKYLQTPKIYENYLQEFFLENSLLTCIAKDIFDTPDLKISGKVIKEKYHLSDEFFQEMMLTMEYSFIACLRYEPVGSHWEEIITPFQEWKEYMSFMKKSSPVPLKETQIVPKKVAKKEVKFSSNRDKMLVERGLKRFIGCGWVILDDFIKAFTGAINNKEPIILKQVGKRWRYVIPDYTESEKSYISDILTHQLSEEGFIELGTYQKSPCFKVTSFGRLALE